MFWKTIFIFETITKENTIDARWRLQKGFNIVGQFKCGFQILLEDSLFSLAWAANL